ncbi:DUF637 domain-containing protein [Endozoicomonas gorgoniicola]|uniref:DUF637 domain-containing protein n=1 Tax=Endozoicomonas gorgoniicola TaxID=1234144 RepID=A0ABT3MYP7_9GAMM|nr:DUF637 domain-containing protein [Endozoicomonas gorgoniicola]MCW7554502.1 DUF637 domain-containing protein [Endozoicomonas gorgoniicola]
MSPSLWSANLVLNGGTFSGDITGDGKGGFIISGESVAMKGVKLDVQGGSVKVKTRVFSETGKSELKATKDVSVETSQAHIKDSTLTAGKNLKVKAEQDLYIESSQLTAKEGSATLSGQTVVISSGRETSAEFESDTKRGFLGTSKRTSEHQEKHDTAVPTEIEADRIHIKANTLMTEATRVKAAHGIRFDARQWLNLAVRDHHCISDEVKRSGLLSTSHKISGHCRTETVHTRLDPGDGVLTLNVQKVEAMVGIEPGQSLSEALDHLVSTYPDLAWIAQLRNHHQVQWQTVENSYQEWSNKTQGISPLLGVIVTAAVTVATQGVGASFLPAVMNGSLIATNAANAAFSTLVAKSAVDLASNGGDIGQTATQLFSEDTIKTVAVDTIAGGLMGAANTPYLVSPSAPLAQRIQAFGVRAGSRTGAGMVVEGGSLEDQLSSSLSREAWQELAAQANYWAGDYAKSRGWEEGGSAKVALHSSVGAVLGELKDGKPLAGAAAAGTAQATAGLTEDLSHEVQEATSTIIAAAAAQLAGGDPQTGAWLGQTQHHYNRELHREEAGFLQKQIEGLDEEQQARWLAAVCAKVHCSQGLSPDDPHYNTFRTLELAGSDCTTELTQLEASELFTYTRKDATEDFLNRHDEGITRFTGIVQTLAGVGTAAGSVTGGSVLCVSGIGCGLGALISSAGITAGIEEYREGITKLTTEYTTNQVDRVAASFHPDTHPGEQGKIEELGRVAVVAAAELAVGRLGLSLGKASKVQGSQGSQKLDEKNNKVDSKTEQQNKGNNIANSLNARSALKGKLSGLEKAQKTAVKTKQLPDGRIRYYSKEVPARTKGPTRGASFVTEYDPKINQVRQWMESYNEEGDVIRVHPKSIDGQIIESLHYPPTAKELGL